MTDTVYDFIVPGKKKTQKNLADYKGKVLLIVNTASRCGFTSQYNDLEEMYEKFHDSGLEILDFPCNQFGQKLKNQKKIIILSVNLIIKQNFLNLQKLK